jgi:hypothetical protein
LRETCKKEDGNAYVSGDASFGAVADGIQSGTADMSHDGLFLVCGS